MGTCIHGIDRELVDCIECDAVDIMQRQSNTIGEMRAEIERLRAELREAVRIIDSLLVAECWCDREAGQTVSTCGYCIMRDFIERNKESANVVATVGTATGEKSTAVTPDG